MRLPFLAFIVLSVFACMAYFVQELYVGEDDTRSFPLPTDWNTVQGTTLTTRLEPTQVELVHKEEHVTAPPTSSSCHASELESFLADQKRVLGKINFKSKPILSMPWYYADTEALCGKHLLHYQSNGGIVFRLEKPIMKSCMSGGPCTIAVKNCGWRQRECGDILLSARVVSSTVMATCEVKYTPETCSATISLDVSKYEPGRYSLHVKVTHINGSSEDPKIQMPMSLGVIGIRVPDNGKKSFRHNGVCDAQRHILGSPHTFIVENDDHNNRKKSPVPPHCTKGNYSKGRWVHTPTCRGDNETYCSGDPSWLSDACGFNYQKVWVPDECRYHIYPPESGPQTQCVRRRGLLTFVGDSIIREYFQNCLLHRLNGAGLACNFENIMLKGQFYSEPYAISVAEVIAKNAARTNPVVFATNLGMLHMIGHCTTAQWRFYVQQFANAWKAAPPAGTERMVWLGPPTIHYASKGMGAQRARKWDIAAWEVLKQIGFERLDAYTITAPREESSWDGLHNAAERGKKQTVVVYPSIPIRKWNGGVSGMLFAVLLNMLCPYTS
eukprot:PhF_6_TR11693/c0_g1_i1/m.18979